MICRCPIVRRGHRLNMLNQYRLGDSSNGGSQDFDGCACRGIIPRVSI